MPPEYSSPYKFRSSTVFLLTLLLLAALGAAGYYSYENREIKKELASKNTSNQAEIDQIISAVGKLLILPQNEKPTVATVADAKALKDQPFFANAQNGDRVLIYTGAKQAILYRQSINKIIAVSPIVFESQATSTASTSTKSIKAK